MITKDGHELERISRQRIIERRNPGNDLTSTANDDIFDKRFTRSLRARSYVDELHL